MKKSFLMLGLAVAAMSSCTNDEVIDMNQSNQKAIGFESFVNKGTRATVTNEVKADNLNRFYVYGYHDGTTPTVFDNVSVIKSGGVWSMEANNERDWETQSYNFAAYADGVGVAEHAQSTLTTSFTNAKLTFTSYAVNETQANQTDLIAAFAERDNTNSFTTTKVDLSFRHLLSKVSFTFENTNTSNLSMEVSNVKLKVKNSADCECTSRVTTWKNHASDATEYTLVPPTGKIAKGATSEVSAEYFVIPDQTGAKISFTVTYYDASDQQVETYNKELSLFTDANDQSVSWTPSYIYKYNVQLPASPQTIEFNVSGVGTWEEANVTLDGSK